MEDDREIARRALDLQARAKDYAMFQIPGYSEWSDRKLAEGESEAFILNLDEQNIWLRPEDLTTIKEEIFEEMLQELKDTCAELELKER